MDILIDNYLKPVTNLYADSQNLRIMDSETYDINIKINFLTHKKARNDKIKLRKLMMIYF